MSIHPQPWPAADRGPAPGGDLAAAARIFAVLGSEARLTAYRRLLACPTGLPLSELRRRSVPGPESLSVALSALEAAGLVHAEGDGDEAWYTARVEPLADALDVAAT